MERPKREEVYDGERPPRRGRGVYRGDGECPPRRGGYGGNRGLQLNHFVIIYIYRRIEIALGSKIN
jgi:hypothetical protein